MRKPDAKEVWVAAFPLRRHVLFEMRRRDYLVWGGRKKHELCPRERGRRESKGRQTGRQADSAECSAETVSRVTLPPGRATRRHDFISTNDAMNIHDGDDDDDDEPDVRVGVTARCPPILPSRQANSVQCVRVFVYSSPCVAFVREHRYARSMQHHMTNSRPTMRTVCVLARRHHHHHYLQRPAHADGAAGAVAAGDLVGI